MKKLEFLNPSLFNIRTNINGYLDERNNLVQISGYYTDNEWINIGFYIKANNVSTTIENSNTITYLVYDLTTNKYSFINSLNKPSINKLYFKLYVNNNKFYASPDDIMPNLNAYTTSLSSNLSLSSNISNTALYSLSTNNSNIATLSLTTNYSTTSLYSLSTDISLTTNKAITTNNSNYAIKSLSSNISLTSLYSLSSNSSIYSLLSYTAQSSLSTYYSITAIYANYAENLIVNKFSKLNIPYTRIFVDTNFPSTNILNYDSFYNINTKELFVFVSNSWQKINWQQYIKNDRLYKEGKLRINPSTTTLEIQSADNTWYEIIPTIGVIFTPINYANYVYYITPGQTYNGFSSSFAPIMAINGMAYRGIYSHTYAGEDYFGIIPSGIVINNGVGTNVSNSTGGRAWNTVQNKNFVPIINQSGASLNFINYTTFSIQLISNTMYTTAIGTGYSTTGVSINIGYGSFSTNGYYLGIWCYEGTPVTVNQVSIRREY
jgi:hypothetical protein